MALFRRSNTPTPRPSPVVTTPNAVTRPRRKALHRQEARQAILDAATIHARYLGTTTTYRMRHLQRAVFVCRQNKLVKAPVLRSAGFKASR